MKKNLLLISSLVVSGIAFGQVGINNEDPKATLDVTAKQTNATTAEGIIAPRLSGDEIKGKDAQYTAAQTGTLLYATAAVGTSSAKTINITSAGYYYFDGTVWMKVNTGAAVATNGPWFGKDDNMAATDNTEDIYQMGKVGFGLNNPVYQADILGILNQKVTLGDGRVNSLHSGDNVIGSGIKGAALTSQLGTDLNYILAGDVSATGGSANSSLLGMTNFSDRNAIFSTQKNGTGDYVLNLGISNPNTNANIDMDLTKIRTNINDGTNSQNFDVLPDALQSSQYPNTRNDNAGATPIAPTNFLYTDNSGKFLSAPVSDIVAEPFNKTGTTTKATLNTEDIYQMGKVGFGLNNPAYQVDVSGTLNQTVTLPSGRINSIHSGNNVLGAGIQGVSMISQNGSNLGYLLSGDATATGGFVDQTGFGLTNFGNKNANLLAFPNGSGDFAINIGLSNANLNANTDYNGAILKNYVGDGTGSSNTELTTSAIKNYVNNGTNSHNFDILPTFLQSSQYPNTRNDNAGATPVIPTNFLYTDNTGNFLSAPVTSLSVEPWFKAGTNIKATDNSEDIYMNGKVGVFPGSVTFNVPTDYFEIGANDNTGITIRNNSHDQNHINFINLANGGNGEINWFKTPDVAAGPASLAASVRSYSAGSYSIKGLSFYTGNFSDGVTDAVERMRINEDGKIGIGQTSPTNILHVKATTDPVRLEGLQSGNIITDKVIVADANGVLKTISAPDLRVVGLGNHITQDAGVGQNGTSAGTGASNLALVAGSLASNTTGSQNIAIGQSSLASNTDGFENIAIGSNAMSHLTAGFYNTVVGPQSLLNLTSGSQNSVFGRGALGTLTTGDFNSTVGMYSLNYLTNGSGNIGLGNNAGNTLTSGDYNIFIGINTVANVGATASNQLNIGNWIYGDNGKIGIGSNALIPSERLDISNGNLRIQDINTVAGANTDKIVVADANGVFKTIPANTSAAIATKTANYTVSNSDETILVNASGGTVTISLPTTPITGKRYNLKKIDSSANAAIISGNGKNIDGNPTVSATLPYQGFVVQYDGANWYIISKI